MVTSSVNVSSEWKAAPDQAFAVLKIDTRWLFASTVGSQNDEIIVAGVHRPWSAPRPSRRRSSLPTWLAG